MLMSSILGGGCLTRKNESTLIFVCQLASNALIVFQAIKQSLNRSFWAPLVKILMSSTKDR